MFSTKQLKQVLFQIYHQKYHFLGINCNRQQKQAYAKPAKLYLQGKPLKISAFSQLKN